MDKGGYVYILTNQYRTVLYTGVTSNLDRRFLQHLEGNNPKSFTSKYKCNILIYYEEFPRIELAIAREKNIKNWHRAWKEELIESMNPNWDDLWNS